MSPLEILMVILLVVAIVLFVATLVFEFKLRNADKQLAQTIVDGLLIQKSILTLINEKHGENFYVEHYDTLVHAVQVLGGIDESD